MTNKKQKYTTHNNVEGASSQLQTILDSEGKPAFVVIPYEHFIAYYDTSLSLVPNEVIEYAKQEDVSAVRAWRDYLGLSQLDVAAKMGVSQPALAQFEAKESKLRMATMHKIAKAMGITVSQINW